MTDQPFRTNDRRVIPWLLFGLLVLFGGLYVAGYLFTSDKIPRGTTVSGVELGGLSPAAAERRLQTELAPQARQPIRVSVDGERTAVPPAEAGLSVDVPASVAQAGGGRSWNPARMWDYFTGGDDLDAVVRADQARLDAAVAALAEDVDQPAREGDIRFKGDTVRTVDPVPGEVLDRDAAARLVQDGFLGDTVVELPTRVAKPDVDAEDVSQALKEFANPAVSGPVTYRLGGEQVVLRPRDFSPALAMEPEDGELVPVLDEKRLLKVMDRRMRSVAGAPQDAAVRLVNGRPQVIPAKKGVTFDPKAVTDSFLDLVVADGGDRGRDIETVVAEPDFSTAEARALRITEEVSEFTTYFPHADYRNVNLGRAAALVNGTVLKPGDTFSLNGIVGERTAENGFTKGFIISDGVYKEDFGGGVSQVATTTFNAAFFAGLEDVEHKPHSFYIDRYPVGREATVAWPSVDLKFKNDTPYGVLVQAWITPSTPSSSGAMHVRMWSTKYWDIRAGVSERYNFTEPETRHIKGEECVPHEGYGGFDIDVYRYFYRHGSSQLHHKETMHTTYTPSDSVVCS